MTERVVRIEKLVHGGDGLARDEGRVVFVPLVAEGDLVRVELEPKGTRAKLLEVIEHGPSRVTPDCPEVGRCGGCDRQQVSIEGQRKAKQDAVAEALVRIGGLDDASLRPLVPSPRTWRYRRRMRAQVVGEGWGFVQGQSHRALKVPACLLVEEEVESLANAFSPALKKAGLPPIDSFGVDVAGGKGAIHLALKEKPSLTIQARASRLLAKVPGLRGLVLSGPEGAPATVGDPVLVDEAHHRLRIRPDLFAQANRLGARIMADHVASTVTPGSRVLELYAGSGTLTLPIAKKGVSLVASEGDGPGLTLLRTALTETALEARLVGGPAKRVVEGLVAEQAKFDHVVLDPPRAGAKEAIDGIIRLAPGRITYVSCDPATFARDASAIVAAGWKLVETTPYDLFPQTHHVELVALFERA